VGLTRFDIFQTDSEGNIGNMRFFRPIPEPQVTEPELLQEKKNDIVGNKILHCGKLMDMFNKFYKKQLSKVGIVMASRIKM
jgi:hypothetical protein